MARSRWDNWWYGTTGMTEEEADASIKKYYIVTTSILIGCFVFFALAYFGVIF